MKMSNTEVMRIEDIVVGSRLIALNAERVKGLADSIRELGLLQPVVVTADRRLIAGLHRLKACESLGWAEIPAVVSGHTDKRVELAEVDENLVRNNLTALEEGELLIKRKAIYVELYPSTKKGVDGAKAKHAKAAGDSATAIPSFAADTAAKTGQSERNVQNKIAAVSKLPEDIREAIRGTDVADNFAEMKKLGRFSKQPELQKRIASYIQHKLATTVGKAALSCRGQQMTNREDEVEELRAVCRKAASHLNRLAGGVSTYGSAAMADFVPEIEQMKEVCHWLLMKIGEDKPSVASLRAA
jgi:ParB family transcriptional regulator, chromosome partitioning protein